MKLTFIPNQDYMIVKFPPEQPIPSNFHKLPTFKSITYTHEECSVIVPTGSINIDRALDVNTNWAIIQIIGILDFSLVGILAQLATPLAENNISIFALSTFNTDYLLIKNTEKEKARLILEQHGHLFI